MTLRIADATITPIQVDGGCDIAGSQTDSVGILYPGERVDLIVNWKDVQKINAPQVEIYLDPEYVTPFKCLTSPLLLTYATYFRNFNYPNPALTPNQSFPLLPSHLRSQQISTPPSDLTPDVLPMFDIQTATSLNEPSIPTSPNVDQTLMIYAKTTKLAKFSNHPMGFINHTTWIPQPQPLLTLPRSAWDSHQLVPFIPIPSSASSSPEEGSTWLDIVINNLDDGSHPFHLHGHDFYIMASHRATIGWGSYNPFSADEAWNPIPEFNFYNPLRKDTVSVPRHGFVVIRVRLGNEGLWMLHCHVLVHQASGMAMGVHFGQVGGEEHVSVDGRAGELCSF